MTNKNADTKRATKKTEQASDEVLTAYEIHTLAQITYRQLAEAHPWALSFSTSSAFSPPEAWPPEVAADPAASWTPLPWVP